VFGIKKRKGPTLGLEVNSQSLSVVQLEKTKLGVELVRFSEIPTPPNTVREGLIADPDTVGSVVQDLLVQAGLGASGGAVVNAVVPGQSVVIRLMPVPTGMPPDELADVVTQEAINHVPFPIKEANLDWSIMPATERTDADGVRRVDVILAAIQKTIVDSYWRMAESAGVTVDRLDISSLATIRALSFAGYLEHPDSLYMSVNVRHEATDINLVRNGMPLFTRSVLLGVETLAEAVSRSLDVSTDDGLAMLPAVQLFGMAAPDPRTGQAAQIARTVFGDITDEVARSLEFYRSQVGDVVIERIILCGPGCQIPQIEEFISNRLNIPAAIANPFGNLAGGASLVPPERVAAQTMVTGSVVEPSWAPVITVDLNLNKEGPSAAAMEGMGRRTTVTIVEEPTPWFLPAMAGGLVVLALVLGFWLFLTQIDGPAKQKELQRLTEEIDRQKKQVTDLTKLREDIQVLARKKQVLDEIVKYGRPWAAVLKTIADDTPDGVQLKEISITGSRLKVAGTAVDFARVSNLAINLGSSPLLSDAAVEYAKRDTQTDPRPVAFEVVAQVRPNSALSSLAASSVAK